MQKELLNTQIEALTGVKGAEIVQFYKENGFDTSHRNGIMCKKDNDANRYYGVDVSGEFNNRTYNSGLKTITLEEAKALVDTKDFSKMDLETWLIETEKLGLSEYRLQEHIFSNETCPFNLFNKILESQGKKYGTHDYMDLSKILYNKWNPKNKLFEETKNYKWQPDLYTEITAYKLQDGSIVESKELAEITAKEIKIKNELSNYFDEDFIIRIMQNLEKIKKIINQ